MFLSTPKGWESVKKLLAAMVVALFTLSIGCSGDKDKEKVKEKVTEKVTDKVSEKVKEKAGDK